MMQQLVIAVFVLLGITGVQSGFSFDGFPDFNFPSTSDPPPSSQSAEPTTSFGFESFNFGSFPTPNPASSPSSFSNFNSDVLKSFNGGDNGGSSGGDFGGFSGFGSLFPSPSPSLDPSPSPSPSPPPPTSPSPSPSPPPQQTCPYDNVAPECSNAQPSVIPYILNGQQASPSQWPSVVSLQFPQNPAGCYRHMCGGVLIASRFVLTAAHCIQPVIQGTGSIPQGQLMVAHTPLCRHDAGKGRIAGIFVTFIDGQSFPDRDLAIIELQQGLSGPYASLPPQGFDTDDIAGSSATIVGWGRTQEFQEYEPQNTFKWNQVPLQQGRFQIISREQCRNLVSISITDEMFCTGEQSQSRNCVGDSGSPLFKDNMLIGITIFGVEKARDVCLPPAGFAHVSSFTQWINGVINS